tara:strand:+ start:239 stop:421 length:183 start_codon:yes stop_codon:yes gene_type:complete
VYRFFSLIFSGFSPDTDKAKQVVLFILFTQSVPSLYVLFKCLILFVKLFYLWFLGFMEEI